MIFREVHATTIEDLRWVVSLAYADLGVVEEERYSRRDEIMNQFRDLPESAAAAE